MIALLLWTGCVVNPTTGEAIGELSVSDGDIAVSPGFLDFGSVALGTSGALTVTVQNVGVGALQLLDVSVRAGGESFTVTAPGSLAVEPGGSTTFNVTYTPSAPGAAQAELRIASTDPDEGEFILPLLGEAHGPLLTVTPDGVDLGSVAVGCDTSTAVTLRNAGDADLLVSSLALAGAPAEITLTLPTALPWTLTPGAEQVATLTYAPLENAADGGELRVSSTDPIAPERVVSVTGTGAIGESVDESFVQGHTEQIDVIVVTTELSDSAKAEAADLLDAYLTTLDASGIDFHLLVADSYGCHAGTEPYLTAADDPADRTLDLARALDAGIYSGYADQGLMRASWAIANNGAGYYASCNIGFSRAGAHLHLLGIADGPDAAAGSWMNYEDDFISFKGEDAFTAHAVAPDDPGGCDRYDAGEGWSDIVDDTSGLYFSFCAANWSGFGDELAALTPGQRTTWTLTATPVPETITVTVDGDLWLSGWSYVAGANQLLFSDVPEPESQVEITYVAEPGTCP